MNKRDPIWWAAKSLHRLLGHETSRARSPLRQEMHRLLEHQQAIGHCWRRSELAASRGWHCAAALERVRLLELLPSEQYYIRNIIDENPRRAGQIPPPTLRELLAELRQLSLEFDHVIIEPRNARIAVRTEPITLEDVRLGRFQIDLQLKRLQERIDSSVIDIIALDPNPAGSNEEVTHPHVSDDALCPGDAAVPLRNALAEGRLCDVFLLVQGVLSTYNPASAYVSLEEWSGTSCSDCGGTCRGDDLYYCPSCQREFCHDCIGACDACDDAYCAACLEREHGTRRNLCPNCRAVCPNCDHVALASEVEEHGLCGRCREEQQQEEEQRKEEEHEEQEPSAQTHAA